MTPEEAQKRLRIALNNFGEKLILHDYIDPDNERRKAEQALSELFRDVIGEIVGPDYDMSKFPFGNAQIEGTVANRLKEEQRDKAARYFPVDGGGEK